MVQSFCWLVRQVRAHRIVPPRFRENDLVGLEADGGFLSLGFDGQTSAVNAARERDGALLEGARFYPELKVLVPTRGNLPKCVRCNGAGTLNRAKDVDEPCTRCDTFGFVAETWR